MNYKLKKIIEIEDKLNISNKPSKTRVFTTNQEYQLRRNKATQQDINDTKLIVFVSIE